MYVEDFEGRVGIMTQIEDLDAVAAALDRRGVRELALSAAIDKAYKYAMHATKAPSSSLLLLLNTCLAIPASYHVLRQSAGKQHNNCMLLLWLFDEHSCL